MGKDTVAPIAQAWFQYKSKKVTSAFKDMNVTTLEFLPILAAIMNIVFLLGCFSIFWLKGFQKGSLLQAVLVLALALWAVNFGFSVFASPVTLRYQLFSILLFSSFALLLVDKLYHTAFASEQPVNKNSPIA